MTHGSPQDASSDLWHTSIILGALPYILAQKDGPGYTSQLQFWHQPFLQSVLAPFFWRMEFKVQDLGTRTGIATIVFLILDAWI